MLSVTAMGLVAVLQASAIGQPASLAPCDSLHPKVGRLRIEKPPVRIVRAGNEGVVVGRRGSLDLCAGDDIYTAAGVAYIIVDQVESPIPKGRSTALQPVSEDFDWFAYVRTEIANNFGLLVADGRARNSAGQQSADQVRFGVAGLAEGRSIISPGARSLEIPIIGPATGYTVSLVDPNGRRIVGRIFRGTPARAPRIVFPETTFVEGERWFISVENAFASGSGGFSVASTPIVLPPVSADLAEEDRAILGALALSAMDLDRWSLEAFQRISGRQSSRFRSEGAEMILASWAVAPWTVPEKRR